MRHLTIYISILLLVMMASCSQSPKVETAPASDTISVGMDDCWKYEPTADTTTSEKADEHKTVSQAKPVTDERSFFQRGYDEGYDAGREDGTMDLGDGYSYCDANPYKGAAKREYERGYKRGYKKGYHEGFNEYSDGDEEIYDEY